MLRMLLLLKHLGHSVIGTLVVQHYALAMLTTSLCNVGRQHWNYWRLCRLLRPLQCEACKCLSRLKVQLLQSCCHPFQAKGALMMESRLTMLFSV